MNKKNILIIVAVLTVLIGIFVFVYYTKIYATNVVKQGSLFIKKTDAMQDLETKLTPFIKNYNSFSWVANKKNYNKPKPGRYLLKVGMTNNQLVNMLRSGRQTAVKVSFNNQDNLEKLAGRIAAQLETDSISLLASFKDKRFLAENNLSEKAALQLFIPNSYQFYWTTSADSFRDKLVTEYHRFWNNTRLEKAKKQNLTPSEVITLASIVQKETAKTIERPIVAGLYLNRLKDGWPLQADPTVIYAIKELKGDDYVVKRVLNDDLKINSPYNTYKVKGLPPTLIAMPDISSIDAVLNPSNHNYYYMCASIKKIGFHEFAKTLSQHNRNATLYQRWLSKQGVNR